MSNTEEMNIVRSTEVSTTSHDTDDIRKLIPHRQPDGSVLYKQNSSFRGEVFPLDIKRHQLLMDPDDGWKYFNFNPDSQKGKTMISKYTNLDNDGDRYVVYSEGQKVYGEDAIACEVLNRMHIDYMNHNWVRIQT